MQTKHLSLLAVSVHVRTCVPVYARELQCVWMCFPTVSVLTDSGLFSAILRPSVVMKLLVTHVCCPFCNFVRNLAML